MAKNDDPIDPLDEIVRALDHDLRNPVANILGFVDLVRDAPDGALSREQLEFLDRIDENCWMLLKMFEQLRAAAAR
jgi:signal transduction histidine kinase